MGSLEIFYLDEEGAGWKTLEDLSPNELLHLEIKLFQENAL